MKKTMLRKQTALAAAGLVMLAALPVVPAAAADAPSVLILGDSISAGYGLAEGEYGYYDYIADCTGGNLTNLAVSGMTTGDVISVIDNTSNKDTIADAEIICISAGGNDLMQPAKAYFETKAKEGENLIDTAKRIAKEGDSTTIITELTRALRTPRNTAVANYPVIVEKIRALNPDAQIVFQTTYNPFEMPQEELKASGYSEDTLKKYNTLMTYVSSNEQQLNKAMAALTEKDAAVKVADVSAAFAGNGWLYDRILEKDVHPTPLGHALIAATVMDQLDGINAKSARMGQTVENLKYAVYMQIPADDKNCIGKYALDVKHLTGDFDNNGEVSVEDAQNVLKIYTAGVSGKPIPEAVTALQFVTGNVNGDKELSVDDAQYILIYYVRHKVSGQDITWDDVLKKK
ncbi:MAG: SGNH/GDSL hydrolase family protein [Oscillospiraceae bacterium]|nr:SGNH/GDSL hydrolase family protein [Oscillospiraceae bacterium]